MSRKLNRKQRAAIRRERCSILNGEKFFSLDWTLDDWEKIPRPSDAWTAKPDRERYFIIRVRCVRFSDGTRLKFYQCVARPEQRREWQQMRERARLLLKECQQALTSGIVRNERRFLKTPTPPKPRGRRKD